MSKQFDVVVIGTGMAGSTAAEKCRDAGRRVAIVDSNPFGGTCALRGCDPKKVLVGAAEVIDAAARMRGKGVSGGPLRMDWAELMRFKRSFTDPVPAEREKSMAKAGIAAFHGRARFVSAQRLEIGGETLETDKVIVAAGARPAPLGVAGEELLTTSEQFLNLDALPERILFAGGGYISFELAHIAARTQARVTVLHQGSRPLAGFDPELVDQLVRWSRDIGIDMQLDTSVESIEKTSRGLAVRASCKGQKRIFETDMAVHGAGRVPDIADLGLEIARVEWDPRKGVKVNGYLQSASNPAVYAAGDAAASGGLPLTPIASYEGGIAADNLLNGNRTKARYAETPTVVFTTPPLAAVGLLESAAREQGLNFIVEHADTSGWYSSRRIGEVCSGYKVLIEKDSQRILGAHLLGAGSEEVINIFALAIRSGITAPELKQMIFSYPTRTSDIRYMLGAG